MSKDQFTIQGRWVYSSGPELMVSLREQTADYLLNVTRRILSRADDALFDRAQHVATGDRSEHLDAMRLLRQLRQPLEQAMIRGVETAFGKFRSHGESVVQEATLSMLDDSEDELQALADHAALEILGVHGPALDAIERRFALLRGVRSLDPADNPLSAQHLGEALMAAEAELSLPAATHRLLYALFEAELVSGLAPMLTEINARLIGANILPELGNPRPIEVSADVEIDIDENTFLTAPAPTVEVDDQQFSALCELLHTFRPQGDESAEAQASQRPFASAEILSVLSLLQPEVPKSVRTAMSNRDASLSALLKQEVVAAASRIGLAPEELRISSNDEDALDLVGMLFDVMLDERDLQDSARSMVARMVVPFVKAALVDRSLFQVKTHPARRLLNAVAEAVEGNRGDGPQERDLLQKTEQTINQLVGNFNEDVAIFESLEQELRSFLDQYNHRVELAERRAAEAQRGQDRLVQAREFAQRELSVRCGDQSLPPSLDEFLNRYWTHHLSMIALREGVQAPAWQMAVAVAERLLALLPSTGGDASQVAIELNLLRGPIEVILGSSGLTGDAAAQQQVALADCLLAVVRGRTPYASKPNLLAITECLPVIKPASETAVNVNAEPRPALIVVADKASQSVSASHVQFARSLQVGAWVQIPGDDGQLQAIKLSWISPITSRLMFVNRRGVRVLVASIEELAQMHASGKLSLRDPDQVFDQAMTRMVDRLQSGGAA